MKCPNCESNVASTEKVCPNCGFDFSAPPVAKENEQSDQNIDVDISDNKSHKKAKQPPKKSKLKAKTKIMLALIILLILLLFGTFIFVSINRSNGKRIYNNLSEKLGNTIAIAEKNAGIELMKNSDYKFISDIQDFSYIYECPDTVLINGIHVPEWIIFCNESDNGALEQVIYYDFSIMKINANGVKRSNKLNINQMISFGASISEVSDNMQFEPLVTINKSDKTTTQIYKYYYIDTQTRDEVSYYVTVEFDNNDKVVSTKEDMDNAIKYIIAYNSDNALDESSSVEINDDNDSQTDSSSDDLEEIDESSESMSE